MFLIKKSKIEKNSNTFLKYKKIRNIEPNSQEINLLGIKKEKNILVGIKKEKNILVGIKKKTF